MELSNPGTYTQILYQIVFSTYKREETLAPGSKQELFRYITGILQNKKCHLYRINGVYDHLHMVTHLHPSVSLASLIKDIKLASSEHIKKNKLFPLFNGWQDGYGAFTYSFRDKDRLIEYVKNQDIHHQVKTSRDELVELLDENGIEFDEKYFI
ncbi:MAG: IS200/IS605 family transposase [Bacteroidia bacterium]|nr:IS200/IS605 family transposase [Bacteroidia bacterium]